mgnify:CR=1 FL=1
MKFIFVVASLGLFAFACSSGNVTVEIVAALGEGRSSEDITVRLGEATHQLRVDASTKTASVKLEIKKDVYTDVELESKETLADGKVVERAGVETLRLSEGRRYQLGFSPSSPSELMLVELGAE